MNNTTAQMILPNQPPQIAPAPVPSQSSSREALKYIETQSLARLKESVEPCSIPAELIQELLLQRGADVQDPAFCRCAALGLQQFYCQILERAREMGDSGRLTMRDLAVALIYAGNAPRVPLQFLIESSRVQ